RLRRRDVAGAKSDLQLAAGRAQRRDVRVGSLKALGDVAFDENDLDWSENLYRQALVVGEPKTKPVDEVRYRLGCVLQRKGRWGDADEQFDRVSHVFAGTQVARRAERRLRCLAWTIQAGAFSTKKLAEADASRLRAAKLAAVTRPLTVAGKLQFLVQVGWYDSYERAAAALPTVRRHRSDAFVTPTR
ncbi:MAG: SPOR domain-containing protein, partial [Phycisphaerae bacterium]